VKQKPTNVVPFDPIRRGGMARRGSPDKAGRAALEAVVLECPSCASELRLEAAWLEDRADLLCGRCEAEISFVWTPQESVR
jgi:hypothetical protein